MTLRLLTILLLLVNQVFPAITLSQHAPRVTGTGGFSSKIIAPGSGLVLGQTVIVIAGSTGATTVTAADDQPSGGNVYTLRGTRQLASGNGACAIFSAPVTQTNGLQPNITVSWSPNSPSHALDLYVFSGINNSATVLATGTTGSSTAPNSGTVTTTTTSSLIVGSITHSTGTLTASSGYTVQDTGAVGGITYDSMTQIAAAGSYASDGTLSVTSGWSSCVAAFEATGSSTTKAPRHTVATMLWNPMLVWNSFYNFLTKTV